MKYYSFRDEKLSFFTLGTVQLGMDYGLGDMTAKPSAEKAFEVLDCAMENGINVLDTANNYGDSERVIGRWLDGRRRTGKSCPFVVTKIGPLCHDSAKALREDIIRQMDGCRKTLGMDTLDMVMIHNYEDYSDDRAAVADIFAELHEKGLFRYKGISAYSRHDYRLIAESGFEATQIPLNAFDWSQIDHGGIESLSCADVNIFVRSVFLQGLVFLKPEKVEERMAFCREPLRHYLRLCEEFNLTPEILAMSTVLSIKGVNSVVLGCQTPSQVMLNCQSIDNVVMLTEEQLKRIHDTFQNIDPRVVNPSAWNQ